MSDTLHYKQRMKKKVDKKANKDRKLSLLKKQNGEKRQKKVNI